MRVFPSVRPPLFFGKCQCQQNDIHRSAVRRQFPEKRLQQEQRGQQEITSDHGGGFLPAFPDLLQEKDHDQKPEHTARHTVGVQQFFEKASASAKSLPPCCRKALEDRYTKPVRYTVQPVPRDHDPAQNRQRYCQRAFIPAAKAHKHDCFRIPVLRYPFPILQDHRSRRRKKQIQINAVFQRILPFQMKSIHILKQRYITHRKKECKTEDQIFSHQRRRRLKCQRDTEQKNPRHTRANHIPVEQRDQAPGSKGKKVKILPALPFFQTVQDCSDT